jgi:hypothetical protein
MRQFATSSKLAAVSRLIDLFAKAATLPIVHGFGYDNKNGLDMV